MRKTLVPLTASLLLCLLPLSTSAQDSRAALEGVAGALGATNLKSIEYAGSGVWYGVGQSAQPGAAWPKFNAKSTRSINYETGSLREQLVRTQAENPPRGGMNQPVRGELRQTFVVSGDFAWNVVGDAAAPAPVALADRTFQLWATPHGIVKAALAGKGSMQGRTITLAVPGRFKADALVNEQNLIEKIVGTVAHPVLGDLPIEVTYGDYKDFGGVKFPTKIRQAAGGHPSLDLAVTDVQPNAAVDIAVPDAVRQNVAPYARVTSEKVADGVWFVAGGTHNSALIEMKDYAIVVESPLNEDRAFAVIGEARKLLPAKPIRYVVASHHHFDHSGGLRAFASVNVTVITHDSGRAAMERNLAAPATINPDRMAKSGLTPSVEGVRSKRVLTDGARTVEIHHIAGNLHADDLLMVYLPNEKLLIEADVYSPLAPNVTPPVPPSPFTTAFADQVGKLGLTVERIMPLHGRVVPFAEMNKTIGR